eukprot:PhF_6_TR13256/c2_g2_i4/m.21022
MMSSQASHRRFTFIAHALREHHEGRRQHPLIDILTHILLFDAEDKQRKSKRHTIGDHLLHDCRILYPEQLVDIMLNRKRCSDTALSIFQNEETSQTEKRQTRRQQETQRDQRCGLTENTFNAAETSSRCPKKRGPNPRQPSTRAE